MRKLLVLSLALALFAWAQSLFDGTWKMNLSSTTIRGQAGHFLCCKMPSTPARSVFQRSR